MTKDLTAVLDSLTAQEQKNLFMLLRKRFPIHELEKQWHIRAEFVLEAISRSQDITKRGVRGIIAELAFSTYILDPIHGQWKEEKIIGDQPYDAKISREINGKKVEILIQAKNQRVKEGEPLRPTKTAIKQYPYLADWYIAETQKTRTGKKKNSKRNGDGEVEVEEINTRPYRFGEFHILAVCMQPSTSNWADFMFTPARTLLKNKKDDSLIATFQPVPPANSKISNWTCDLLECIDWIINAEKMPAPLAHASKTVNNKMAKKKGESEEIKDSIAELFG